MCGIVGLFLKKDDLRPRLGDMLTDMLITMTDRGPDSAGIAIYGAQGEGHKITVQSDTPVEDFAGLDRRGSSNEQQLRVELNKGQTWWLIGIVIACIVAYASFQVYELYSGPREDSDDKNGNGKSSGNGQPAHPSSSTLSACSSAGTEPRSRWRSRRSAASSACRRGSACAYSPCAPRRRTSTQRAASGGRPPS